MTNVSPAVPQFTGGIVGRNLQGRVDIQAYPFFAERMENFWTLAQGPMTRRPGLRYIGTVANNNSVAHLFPFTFSLNQSYLVVANNGVLQFYINDGILDLAPVSTTITNGDFSAGPTGWTDSSTGAGSATVIGARLWLDSDGASRAIAQQALTIAPGDNVVRHILRFEVFHGPLNVRIGSTAGNDDLLDVRNCATGIHQLEFTPSLSDNLLLESGSALLLEDGDNVLIETGTTVYLQFWHTANAGRVVDSVSIMTGSTFELAHPYSNAALPEVQFEQIKDVLYLVHKDYVPRRLERRGHRSWSLVKLLPDDGPFGDPNISDISLTASATSGQITLTASGPEFGDGDNGNLFKLVGTGQTVTKSAAAADIYTDGIKVTGIGSSARQFRVDITGSFTATVTLQRSSGNENAYADWQTYTAPTAANIYDAQDNQTWFYRLGVKSGNYTSGTVTMTLTYSGGSSNGIVRVISVDSPTQATCEVVEVLASTQATTNWRRGGWNGAEGYPAAITQGYGRLWFGRDLKVWGSVSDDFTSFEDGTEDDRAMVFNIAADTGDGIRAMAFVDHLAIFTQTTELLGSPNTSSEPVGPTNFKIDAKGFEGAKLMQPVTTTGSALFVHRAGRKLMQFTQNPRALSDTQYISVDLNRLSPEITEDGIKAIAVQYEPERRIYCVLNSGRCVVLLFRREEDIAAWSEILTDGIIEDVEIVPQQDQDVAYFVVRRVVGGTARRFIERLSTETVINEWQYEHLDSSLSLDLTYPNAGLTPSGATGSITLLADSSVFTAGDVGKIVWLAGGRAQIAAYSSGFLVTATVLEDLETDEDDIVQYVPSGRWGLGAEVSSVSGLTHLEGRTVRIYADMADGGTAVVTGGAVTLPSASSQVVIGLPFASRWKSLKLSYGAAKGTALTMMKGVKGLGMLFARAAEPILRGGSFRSMKPILFRTAGRDSYSSPLRLFTGEQVIPFDTQYRTDPRVCLKIDGPAPCTVVGYVPDIEEHDRVA